MSTQYTMSFDFQSQDQKDVLQQLQAGDYTLLAYKGATGEGASQVSVGLPTWFAVPFSEIFGEVEIDYTPQYKVYVFNQATIAANTVIQMQVLSNEIGLGNSLNFNEDGSFTSAGSSPDGTITLHNLRDAGTSNITVGLAGLVNLPTGASQYLPFCAFTLTPLGSVEMMPAENIAMMAAQVSLQSGNVQANASAPGCTFTFDSSDVNYQLMVTPSTLAITNQPQTLPVTAISSGQALDFLNN
jgi:hypothetical protein